VWCITLTIPPPPTLKNPGWATVHFI
jgi:hypothetical protein